MKRRIVTKKQNQNLQSYPEQPKVEISIDELYSEIPRTDRDIDPVTKDIPPPSATLESYPEQQKIVEISGELYSEIPRTDRDIDPVTKDIPPPSASLESYLEQPKVGGYSDELYSEIPRIQVNYSARGFDRVTKGTPPPTATLESYPEQQKPDGYFDKLIKYIPTEIVGAWIAITGLIKSSSDVPAETILWVLFVVFIGFTVLYINKQTAEPNKPRATTQIAISTGAFIVWVFALGEPFSYLAFYDPVYGSLVLILYNLIIPLIEPES